MAEPDGFETGDCVELKSGGMVMVVKWVVDNAASRETGREPGVVCQWHDQSGVPHECTFPPRTLEKV